MVTWWCQRRVGLHLVHIDSNCVPVDLSVGPAGSGHRCGPDHHHAGTEDSQGSSSSPGRVPLRWYQGKKHLDLRTSDQTKNQT